MTGYDATLTLERPPDPDGLGRSTGTAEAVYDGPADVQEGGVTRRTEGGQAFRIGDAKTFLPDGESVAAVQQQDTGTVTWPDGSTQAVTVAEMRRLDETIVLTYAE